MSTHVDKDQLKAVPTEYRGVTYRSKSEAMFAVWLGRNLRSDILVQYEPEWSRVGDYVFDFALAYVSPLGRETPKLSLVLIEYKPSLATDCYRLSFLQKCELVAKQLEPTQARVSFRLYEGSFWETFESQHSYVVFENGKALIRSFEPAMWLTQQEASAIRSIRFDLKGRS